jgi:hypothetical protein
VQYPYYVMQFDHLGDKEFTIGLSVRRSVGYKRLMSEIAKCEVVCANCHAERTFQRMQEKAQSSDAMMSDLEMQPALF